MQSKASTHHTRYQASFCANPQQLTCYLLGSFHLCRISRWLFWNPEQRILIRINIILILMSAKSIFQIDFWRHKINRKNIHFITIKSIEKSMKKSISQSICKSIFQHFVALCTIAVDLYRHDLFRYKSFPRFANLCMYICDKSFPRFADLCTAVLQKSFPRICKTAGHALAFSKTVLSGVQASFLRQGMDHSSQVSSESLPGLSTSMFLVIRKCKSTLYFWQIFCVSFVEETPWLTEWVILLICPTKSSPLKHHATLGFKCLLFHSKWMKVWCLATMPNEFLSFSKDQELNHL